MTYLTLANGAVFTGRRIGAPADGATRPRLAVVLAPALVSLRRVVGICTAHLRHRLSVRVHVAREKGAHT